MEFTYYGHSCFSVTVNKKKLLFDPFITGNELAKDIDINSIEADYILLSHGHFDHTADVESIATRTGATRDGWNGVRPPRRPGDASDGADECAPRGRSGR